MLGGVGSADGGGGGGGNRDWDGVGSKVPKLIVDLPIMGPVVGSGFSVVDRAEGDAAVVVVCPLGPPFPARIIAAADLFVHPTITP
jgi:hypothetical protein